MVLREGNLRGWLPFRRDLRFELGPELLKDIFHALFGARVAPYICLLLIVLLDSPALWRGVQRFTYCGDVESAKK